MKINKKILAIDLVLVAGSLLLTAYLVGYARPLVIAPTDDFETTNTAVLFDFDKANKILIDDNLDFSSPEVIYAKDDLVINLKPGTYYWKVEGALSSEIRSLTVISEIDLKIKESGDKFSIVNSGNTRFNVDVYEYGKLKGKIVLEKDEESEANGTKFIGSQNE